MNNITTILTCVSILLMWEHIGFNNNFVTPSIFLEFIKSNLKDCFLFLGMLFAIASSFIVRIDFDKFFKLVKDFFGAFSDTVLRICKPLFESLYSPVYFVNGYYDYALEVFTKNKFPLMITGSIILSCIIVFVTRYVMCKYFSARKNISK